MAANLNWRVWLSGASSGIGEAMAKELGLRGCRVALFARRGERLRAIRDEILGPNRSAAASEGSILVQPGDVTDRVRVHEAVREAEEAFGGIDVLLLNAGTGDTMFPEQFSSELVETIFRVNFFGAIYAIEAALPGMIATGGARIVGVSSIAGVRGFPGSGPYSSSKAAFTTFLESLRLDLRRKGVRVITVTPGFIKTPLTDRNEFPMPFLQPVDKAARRILRGIERGKREIHFPKRLTVPLKLLRCVPGPLYDWLLGSVLPSGFQKRPITGS